MKSFEQMKANRLRERLLLNKAIAISIICLIVIVTALFITALVAKLYFLFIPIALLVVVDVVVLVIIDSRVRKKEVQVNIDKLRKIVDNIVIKDEYELQVMDYDFAIKATKKGFIIDNELYGYENFDVFLGTSNLFRQVSLAVFVVSNFSPFSDDKTYPINFGIVLDEEVLGCAKQYFFESDYKAFNFILENPEQSAKEILKYGLLKIQIEEQKKEKELEKLADEMSNF